MALAFSSTSKSKVRIGASTTAANGILPPLLGNYRNQYPGVELELHLFNSGRALESLARGEIDVAVIASATVPTKASVLAEIPDEVLLVAPSEHPFGSRRMKPVDLAGCDFIHRDAASDTRALVTDWLRAEGVHLRTVLEVGWPGIARRLVGAGLGLSALSRTLVEDDLRRGILKTVRVAGWPLRRKIRIVQLRNAYVSKAVDHFMVLAGKRIRGIRFVE